MLRVSGTVINDQLNLVGLAFRGQLAEFGEMGEGEVTRLFGLGECARPLQRCSNFGLNGSRLVSKNGVKLNDLKMYHKGVEVSNEMTIVTRLIQNDKLIGFEVKFGLGVVKRFSTKDCIKLSGWFKGTNFLVRTRDGKEFLAGKGCSLEDIPALYGGKNKKKRPATEKPQAPKNESLAESGVVGTVDLDLSTLFDTLGNEGCYVIEMPNTEYKRVSTSGTKVDEGFNSLNMGSVAFAKLAHHKDKMDSNLEFKKPGIVNVPGLGPVLTFTYATKTIFRNGSNHISHVGVVVDSSKTQAIMNFLQSAKASIKAEVIEDNTLKKNVAILTGLNGAFDILKVDISGMKLLSDEHIKTSVLDTNTVMQMTARIEMNGLILKAIKPVISAMESKAGVKKEICPRFAQYNESALQALEESNIDIYTGAYNGVIKAKDMTEEEEKSVSKQVKDEDIAIAYTALPNKITKLTAKQLWTSGTGECDYVDSRIAEAKGYNLEQLIQMKSQLDGEVKQLRNKLWHHKMAMLYIGGLKNVHQHDKDLWEYVPTRAKQPQNNYQAQVGKNMLKVKMTGNIEI